MGIPGLYGHWITEYVKGAILKGLPINISSISFDFNGIIHEAKKLVFGENIKDYTMKKFHMQTMSNHTYEKIVLDIMETSMKIVIDVLEIIRNNRNNIDCVIIAVDGVAPGPKLKQQRGRREKSARDQLPGEIFDKNAITPGTNFMIQLDTYIREFITRNRNKFPEKIIYSSHLVPNEGEHKIFDFFRQGQVSDGLSGKDKSHIIYGLDADLIMLSLLSPVDNIFICRENLRESININNLKSYLRQLSDKISVIDDFVVMMCLIGNDFLPAIPSLGEISESINYLLDIYSKGNFFLTKIGDNGRSYINWEGMKDFIAIVANEENKLLGSLTTREFKYPSKFLLRSIDNGAFIPKVFRSLWYQNALEPKNGDGYADDIIRIISDYKSTPYEIMVNPFIADKQLTSFSGMTAERITDMVENYLRMLSWIYLYYKEGPSVVNQDISYPYYHAPMLSDIYLMILTIGTQREILGYDSYPKMVEFTVLHQLVAVLPLKSKALLPEQLKPLFDTNSIIRDLFAEDFLIELEGKNNEHEGIPIIPLVDRQRIIEAVSQIYFSAEDIKKYIPGENFINVRPVFHKDYVPQQNYERKSHNPRPHYKSAQNYERKPYNTTQNYERKPYNTSNKEQTRYVTKTLVSSSPKEEPKISKEEPKIPERESEYLIPMGVKIPDYFPIVSKQPQSPSATTSARVKSKPLSLT